MAIYSKVLNMKNGTDYLNMIWHTGLQRYSQFFLGDNRWVTTVDEITNILRESIFFNRKRESVALLAMVRKELEISGKKNGRGSFLVWQTKLDSRQWYRYVGSKRFRFQLGEELGEEDHLNKEEQRGKGFGRKLRKSKKETTSCQPKKENASE